MTAPAILLAAGQGTRLRPATDSLPKCLVDIGGTTILGHQLRNCQRAGLKHAVVVTGFNWQQVDDEISSMRDELSSLQVETLYNPFFASSNNLITLWSARHVMREGFVLINGDDVFDHNILVRLSAEAQHPITVTIDHKDAYDSDDMKVITDGARLLKINKEIASAEATGESIGIMRFTDAGAARLIQELETMVRSDTGLSDWYTKSVERIAIDGYGVGVVDICGLEWAEIDFPEDLQHVREHLQHLVK